MQPARNWISCLLLAFFPSVANAYCSEPSFYGNEPHFDGTEPDTPASYLKPDVPYCLSSLSYSGAHNCSDYEIEAYIDEVEEYVSELRDYVDDVAEFAREAEDYANEAISFSNQVQGYAEDAYRFAKCEAEEVKTQHE
ncbi:hypothetical protein GCM10007928_43070 [Sulfitobacter porphyrae]|nr:hypothetical protein GCM10007928_43070 [Sulfitobacter porphyrae]